MDTYGHLWTLRTLLAIFLDTAEYFGTVLSILTEST